MNSSERNKDPKNSLVFKEKINETTYERESSSFKEPKTIGQRIKFLRQCLGLTQDALAELLHFETKSSISMYENDKVNLSVDILRALCNHLNTTPNYLVGQEDWDDDLAEIISLLTFNKDPQIRKTVLAVIKSFIK